MLNYAIKYLQTEKNSENIKKVTEKCAENDEVKGCASEANII